jgi:hypothetical protein
MSAGVLMFTVEWVVDRGASTPDVVEREVSQSDSLAAVIAAARARAGKMKSLHKGNPPDGFLILDSSGKEVSRWIPRGRPNA